MIVHGCRVVETPLARGLGVWGVVECTVSGRPPREPGEALGELRGLASLLERESGLRVEPPDRVRWEGLAGGMYKIYASPMLVGGVPAEARIVVAEWQAKPLLALAALAGEPEGIRGLAFGDTLEGILVPKWRVPEPRAPGAPSGQKPIPRFIPYKAEPMLPEHPGFIEVVGEDGQARRLGLDELASTAESRRLDFHCVTGWSVGQREWLVTPLPEVVRGLGGGGGGCWLAGESVGGYTAVMPCSEASKGYLALGLDGAGLPAENGGPVRMLIPGLYGWKSVKWLYRIRILKGYSDGFWEALGYHEIGRWSLEERLKIRNPEIPVEPYEP